MAAVQQMGSRHSTRRAARFIKGESERERGRVGGCPSRHLDASGREGADGYAVLASAHLRQARTRGGHSAQTRPLGGAAVAAAFSPAVRRRTSGMPTTLHPLTTTSSTSPKLAHGVHLLQLQRFSAGPANGRRPSPDLTSPKHAVGCPPRGVLGPAVPFSNGKTARPGILAGGDSVTGAVWARSIDHASPARPSAPSSAGAN